ncbi:response regulator [Bradyrhizobium sp. OAE829]|uniref:response regulator n=1 Tax=Bradyrhizobium sp. OAE829 TaxID=2663807 RepID=UPI001A03C4EF
MSKREKSNRKVLVVEDEMMIAMLIEDMLDEFGCELVGPATNVPRALELIGKEIVDVAVLDLNLDGKDTYAIADALRQNNVPFIFATGYGSTGMRPEYGDRPVLQKPFQAKDLETALAEALAGSNVIAGDNIGA